ncbi:1-aminocyclopropane-1-carboxylate deaminase/D-cysteine desulfhydrase [Pseudoflavitalea sp. G-6-1-2]|uniref:1-aminocyclopropane-1-carboxylate deaminase/D-cysteine desulfhydrase n=1 Tax=Pseudoflavitalea sp. G-6-1-2 TaxID=2728841 RepID=UPI00146E4CCF|nr:1-aminocyclopropane-1-carboxylate deaminase/D-cysteine desulfhydrase [Pseudoflavitalea sp. G-6-1-2]NML23319.1 1-aminocyclopropane-1-carboxylate deaminase/D-cysteine desulfhydrase [Pseudoflavitalea sp. G-6-1-2]
MFTRPPYETVDLSRAIVQPVDFSQWGTIAVPVDVLRLDLIHPVISGNKWFKLKYHLQSARSKGFKGILSFGGAWSNHLVAVAEAALINNFAAKGIVRGERNEPLNPALQDAENAGMELLFVNRTEYGEEEMLQIKMQEQFPDFAVIPSGGQSAEGVLGASEILTLVPDLARYSHIACAVGTATMMAGLINSSLPHQQILGFSSLKLSNTNDNTLLQFLSKHALNDRYQLIYDYHSGGFGKHKPELISFMRELYLQTKIPTDIVYTGKMAFGLNDLLQKNFFTSGNRVLMIHSGGLQGNRSLPAGLLSY